MRSLNRRTKKRVGNTLENRQEIRNNVSCNWPQCRKRVSEVLNLWVLQVVRNDSVCRSPFKLGTRLKGVKEKESNELNQPGASCLEEPRVWSPANRTDWEVKVAQLCLTLCNPMKCSPWNYPGQNTGVGSRSLLQGYLPNPGIEPRPPTLQVNFLPVEPEGKPKNTGVGSLSLPQQIFPTQESNWGLLHCRRILYQLSYQIEKSLWRFKEGCPAGTCRWGSLRSRLHLQSPWNPLGGREGRKTGLTEKLSSEVASVVASLWGLWSWCDVVKLSPPGAGVEGFVLLHRPSGCGYPRKGHNFGKSAPFH